MPHTNRRTFLKSAGAAAIAGPLAGAAAADRPGYLAAVRAERSLLALWTFDGDLTDAKSGETAAMGAGKAAHQPGPVGGRAIALSGGSFVAAGARPDLDVDECSVELFFRLSSKPAAAYNPCLIAKRADSGTTRFSVHVMADLRAIAVWNGSAVTLAEPPDLAIAVGEWRHLAVTSRSGDLRICLDGVECLLLTAAGPFTTAQKNLPLVIGASGAKGEEACECELADAAIYGAALTSDQIARHVDAAGWQERRKRLSDLVERRRLEREKQAAEREARRRDRTAQRMRDPRLFARGSQQVYRGERLEGISLGLGGIGAGLVQINGKGERPIWQIFNNFTGVAVPDTFFAVRAQTAGQSPVVRALQASRVGPFAPMAGVAFRGEYPFAWHDFEDPELPVSVTLESWSPLIPHDERSSAMPCAVFAVRLRNSGKTGVRASVLGTQQNAIGITPDAPVLARRHKGYGGNLSAAVRTKGGIAVDLTKEGTPGGITFSVDAPAATVEASWEDARALHDSLAASGRVTGAETAGPTASGMTMNAALCAQVHLAPGQERVVRFVLSWHFPQARHGDAGPGWAHDGNMYANWWSDSRSVALHAMQHMATLEKGTRAYHDALYESNLPRWLVDRVSSQVAVLRSKTCYWAADGYLGGWEGCAPDGGCCFGNCDHVWHYAQAHARLFPSIGRRLREQTFGSQLADGHLPHRQPKEFPAIDGQCGEILGAYREHLCSADGSWLKAWWPRIRNAMDATVSRWDPNEDGVLAGAQWNTLDGALGGSTTWIGSLYLAALAACERMAEIGGETDTAKRYRRIRLAGAKRQDEQLFNGEYYVQVRDPEPRQDYGQGCHIDQCLGEWWAGQVALPTGYPVEHVRSAMAALIRHNFRPDFEGVAQSPRKFAADEDPGLQMIQWPKGGRPTPTILYGDEVMTGFEYSAAGAMIQCGMLREGLLVARAVWERYDGRLRQGLTPGGTASWGYSGNPFGDDECGKFYARAMSSWGLLIACQGFIYDGPAGLIGFRPVWRPDDHVSFFTAADGIGVFRQRRTPRGQTSAIEVRSGRVKVSEVLVQAPKGAVSVRIGETVVKATTIVEGDMVRVRLAKPVVLTPRAALTVEAVRVAAK